MRDLWRGKWRGDEGRKEEGEEEGCQVSFFIQQIQGDLPENLA